MTDFLIRRFVPDFREVSLPDVRTSYGKLSGKVGLAVNLILFSIKLGLGILSGAISVVADAIHNLADAGSSIVTLLGFKLASKPADIEHPFGHGRVEYLAGLCIAMAILLIGAEMLKTSVEKILEPEELTTNIYTITILISSIFLQLWLGRFNKHIGQSIHSSAIEAASADSLNDCVATGVVVLCLGIHYATGMNIDGWAGLFVALFILHSGWEAARDTIQPLLGQPPSPELVRGIEETARAEKTLCGVHDIIIHDYGPGRIFASLHAEVPSTVDILAAHEAVDDLEEKLRQKYHIRVTVHMDPIVLNDEETNHLRQMVTEIVHDTCQELSIHDFRVTKSSRGRRKLIFDVAVPQHCRMPDKTIDQWIRAKIKEKDKRYIPVIRLDKFYD